VSQKQDKFHEAVMKGFENLDAKVDKLRTEDVPGIHTRMALLEEKLTVLKEDVRKEAKHDAKIYGGIGSAVATFFAVALSMMKQH